MCHIWYLLTQTLTVMVTMQRTSLVLTYLDAYHFDISYHLRVSATKKCINNMYKANLTYFFKENKQ